MKSLKYILIAAVIIAVAFTCKQKDDGHDHSDPNHTHDVQPAAHTHESDDPGHPMDDQGGHDHSDPNHTHGAEDPAGHDHDADPHAVEGDGHDHDDPDADHTHSSGDEAVDHTHPGEDADHTHGDAVEAEEEYDPGHPMDMTAAADHTHDEGAIPIDNNWETLVGLKTEVVRKRSIDEVISVPGRIIPSADKIAVLTPLIESSVNCVMAGIGERVRQGDEMACLSSPEIGTLRADYDKAKAEREISEKNFERRKKLFDEKIISERAFQEAERDKQLVDVNYEYAQKRLLAVGVLPAELDNPPDEHGDTAGSTLHVHAPISGVITKRDAVIGQKVSSGDRLFEIIDLSEVWCEADIFEKDLRKVRIGQLVKLHVSAYPEKQFSGRIFFVGSILNNITKTIKVLISIENRKEELKPGMFSDTYIVTGEKTGALVIPRTAIMEDENLKVVFVKEAAGYHRHVITTGIISDQFAEVISGISENAVVVTTGAYQLKSKARMSTVDPHAGHVH